MKSSSCIVTLMLLAAPVSGSLALEGALVPEVIEIEAGVFVFGSDRAEREAAYVLDELAYQHRVTREKGWYEKEWDRHEVELDGYFISRCLITNRQYQAFLQDTGHRLPDVDPATWKSYRLIHPYERTRRFSWTDGLPPGRQDHPVVLISRADAESYARWLSEHTDHTWRLPSEREWGEGRTWCRWPPRPVGRRISRRPVEQPRPGSLRHGSGRGLSCRGQSVRTDGCGRSGF